VGALAGEELAVDVGVDVGAADDDADLLVAEALRGDEQRA
jgi:hypothetical protein